MTTFAQLQDSLNAIRYRRAIVVKIVEWLDAEFLPGMDGKPRLALLTEEKIKVPDSAFDEIAEYLNSWVKTLAEEEQKLLGSNIAIIPPTAQEDPKEDPKPQQEAPETTPIAEEQK